MNRWQVLGLLFGVRLAMAFQFGTVGAVGPALTTHYAVDAASVGFLVGLYLLPGVVFALPGGALGTVLGDRRTVVAGLLLMAAGAALSASSNDWSIVVTGRAIAGIGGVLLNIVMTKMVTDWFAGREIATAMALFVNSWPAGIALALVVQPTVVASLGVQGSFMLTTALSLFGAVLIALFYRDAGGNVASRGNWPNRSAFILITLAGCIWGLFNAAFAMVFAFGPMLLVEHGWHAARASSAASVTVWVSVVSVPLGGYLIDRLNRPSLLMTAGLLLSAVCLLALPRTEWTLVNLVLLGVVVGLPVGGIMSLPARALAADTRATGMGIFFSYFYLFVVLAPMLAGALIEHFERAGAAMDFGAVLFVIAVAAAWLFDRLAARQTDAH